MEAFRCAIVGIDTAQPLMDRLIGEVALSGIAHPVEVAENTGSLPSLDVLILVSSSQRLDCVMQRIAHERCAHPSTTVLVVGENFDSQQVLAVLSAGACDFVSRMSLPAELIPRLRRALGMAVNTPVALPLDDSPVSKWTRNLVYSGETFARVVAKIPALASCKANVLILGETGTGKEVCAQAIHYQSARASKPWVAVNCGAIPLDLMESELFGHVKGAFTTAHTSRVGLIHEAESGTLFLDDVNCLPLGAQAKLLRFLQEGEYRQVGSNTLQHADVRIIAASNRNLVDLCKRGEFRLDLYFRLNALNLSLPPLRDRREDLLSLAVHFIKQFSNLHHRSVSTLTPGALCKLVAYDWPGNVRELQHVIERSVLFASGPSLRADDIDIDGAQQPLAENDDSFREAKNRVVASFERGYIEHLLAQHCGNVTHAALAAKKDRRAFFELMRKHNIDTKRFRKVEYPA
ncbi:hypothetical protein CJO79_23445 (plasmid) [Ralstonia solanacearum]|nr:hypothetical protein CJO76_23465 [Ralstonia solanacearum]AXV93852.1 hypothetical protein CJO79_23445 [Ralstonia solanacearum]AXW21844.1 hypothetical protein CJO85_23570 [Ralstonia solanacearum]AXW78745.1 hypothetical protein CJO97_23445 [Ralstonia solanacearum]